MLDLSEPGVVRPNDRRPRPRLRQRPARGTTRTARTRRAGILSRAVRRRHRPRRPRRDRRHRRLLHDADLRADARRSRRAAEGAAPGVPPGPERRLPVAFTAGGQTLGKMAMGIRSISDQAPTRTRRRRAFAAAHGAVAAARDSGRARFPDRPLQPDRRGLHDRFAGTRVVKGRRVSRPRRRACARHRLRHRLRSVRSRHVRLGGRPASSGLLLPASPARRRSAICVAFVVGCWSGSVAERHFGGTDPGPVVIDEVMGMLITLFLHPGRLARRARRLPAVPRLRVVKPYPANRLEQLPRRPRRHGRRRHGRHLREPRAARVLLSDPGHRRWRSHESLHHRRRQRAADAVPRRHELAAHHRAAQRDRLRRPPEGVVGDDVEELAQSAARRARHRST